ncbi:hypothetical protein Nepgr_023165 [Nepenthes gracilis]|uniref:Uncharacterized protein n=1 Tax=Nepenthes gracilis TaxID=150966 RepID=A0AAD3T1J3_NEPGR|nr:hypothetical protein Nepgr_023165 [Nepenthes gracilis]
MLLVFFTGGGTGAALLNVEAAGRLGGLLSLNNFFFMGVVMQWGVIPLQMAPVGISPGLELEFGMVMQFGHVVSWVDMLIYMEYAVVDGTALLMDADAGKVESGSWRLADVDGQ